MKNRHTNREREVVLLEGAETDLSLEGSARGASTRGGVTEAAFRVFVEQFERALHDPAIAQIAKSLEREAEKGVAEPDKDDGDKDSPQVVH